ncbi:MAG: MMPL family transporter, partial [Actinomycetota bacterium]
MGQTNMSALMGTRFYRLGALAFRRRWWVLAAWVVIFAAMMGPLQKISDRLSQGGFEVPGSQSNAVKLAIESDFSGLTDITDLLVLRSESAAATDPAFRATFERIRDRLVLAPGVAFVSDPYQAPERSISRDGRVLTAVVGIKGDQDQALANNPAVEKAVQIGAAGGAGIKAYITGAPPFYKAFEDTTLEDLERAEKVAFPVSLFILVIAFGSIVAAGVPLLLALLGLAVAFGIISIIAATATVSTFAQNIASMIGIGVGIDYSLFILTRFREQLKEGRSVSQAVAEAMASSGKAVFVSAMTVVVALAGTQLVDIAGFRSMGFSSMVAVGVAGAAALTLLPALLGLLGPRVDKWSVRKNKTSESRTWHRIA